MNKQRIGTALFCIGQAAIVWGIGLKSLAWAFVAGGVLMVINGIAPDGCFGGS